MPPKKPQHSVKKEKEKDEIETAFHRAYELYKLEQAGLVEIGKPFTYDRNLCPPHPPEFVLSFWNGRWHAQYSGVDFVWTGRRPVPWERTSKTVFGGH